MSVSSIRPKSLSTGVRVSGPFGELGENPREHTIKPLQDINAKDLGGISQPGYSYEESKRENEENEEIEQGDTNGSISTITQGLPIIITTPEQVNLPVSKDNTHPFTLPTQETYYIEIDGNETTEGEKTELKQKNEHCEQLMVGITNAIDTKVTSNMRT
jgi:hypothetical protein